MHVVRHAVLACRTLREAWEAFARFSPLLLTHGRFALREGGASVSFTYEHTAMPTRLASYDAECVLSMIAVVIREIAPAIEDVEEWLDARFPCNDFARGLAPLLHARSEGLPLFVRSLIELLASRRDIEPSNGGFRLAKPLETLDLVILLLRFDCSNLDRHLRL